MTDTANHTFSDDNCEVSVLGFDKGTKGAWVDKYGTIGFDIYGYKRMLVDCVSIQYFNTIDDDYLSADGLKSYMQIKHFNEFGEYQPPPRLDDLFNEVYRTFLNAEDGCGKISSCVRFGNNDDAFTILLKISNKVPIKTSLYFMRTDDNDEFSDFTIDIINPSKNTILHTITANKEFKCGLYCLLALKGDVILRFNKLNKICRPFITAIFFDELDTNN